MTRLRLADPRGPSRSALGRYELLRELAFGRFYSVYLARAPGDTHSVVIKRLRDAYPAAHARARTLREVRVSLALRAPQLVRVLELCDEPELFVVMEHVDGAPLAELLARVRGSDVVRFVVPVLLDALAALSALHGWRDETGAPGFLVHQAPSARHLMVGLDGTTRLLDLSNVHGRILGAMPSAEYTLTDSELAPEQIARASLDPRCDLFIVGTLLRRVLAQSGREDLAGLLEVCERATAPRPEDRYWSAEEMAHGLHHAAVEADLLATQEQVARWVRVSRASLIQATATSPRVRLSLPAPAPALAGIVLPRPDAPPPEPPPEPAAVVVPDLPARSRGRATVIEVLAAPAPPPIASLPTIAASAPQGSRKIGDAARSRLHRALAGLALALASAGAAHTWLNAGPREITATPLAFPAAPRPAAPLLAEPVPVRIENEPPPTPPVVEPEQPAGHEPSAVATVAAPTSEPRPTARRRARDAAPQRAPEPSVPARPPRPARRVEAHEEELVLHEPEVLFYDEEAPAEAPRIGVPVNPF